MFRHVQVSCKVAKASSHAGFGGGFVTLFSCTVKMMRLPQSLFCQAHRKNAFTRVV
jgi:hypothetical protein